VTNPEDLTVLINKYYAMPEDYVPDLVNGGFFLAGQYLRPEADDAWDLMRAACDKDTGRYFILYPDTGPMQRRRIASPMQSSGGDSKRSARKMHIRDVPSTVWAWLLILIPQTIPKSGMNLLNRQPASGKEHGHEYGFILR